MDMRPDPAPHPDQQALAAFRICIWIRQNMPIGPDPDQKTVYFTHRREPYCPDESSQPTFASPPPVKKNM
jgi:hypothetical protein